MLDLGYLNINFDLNNKKIKIDNNVLAVIYKGDFQNKIDINKIMSNCNIYTTID